jgi:DNA mismatch repair protein MutS
MENPKFAKGIVKREVVEVVTPGVALSEQLLDHKKNNYLLAVSIKDESAGGGAGISFADISTGEFYTFEVPESEFQQQLESISPAEILIRKKDKDYLVPLINKSSPSVRISKIDDWIFNYEYGKELLLMQFNTVNLKGFGIEKFYNGIIAAGVVLNYLQETQKVNLTHLNRISVYNPSEFMLLDSSTKRNLEITSTIQEGGTEGTLISILDKTSTAMGGRLLKKWISAPCTGRANPREVAALKTSLKKIPALKEYVSNFKSDILNKIKDDLNPLETLVDKIQSAIIDSPPAAILEGGIIRSGFSPELDELRDISINGKDWIAKLQKTERERTSIPSLKIGYNRVFGYYIDISNAHKEKVPESYIRKQTLVNSERYITPELKEYEDKILNAEEKIYELESQLFNEIRLMAASYASQIQSNARLIAVTDCLLSFAECAESYKYTKPDLVEGTKLEIKNGRHPVVEQILPPGEKFNPNDCSLDNETNQIAIITGPNMAGKSVYIRQVGLIVLMAQIGSFVPAEGSEIGVVDRIFTRVGASDNITGGESTFLVEMQEAGNILNNNTFCNSLS